MVEYADIFLKDSSGNQSTNLFRFADPQNQKMLAIRADMTAQISRISQTRLRASARPLRLSYRGEVLRVRGSQLRPERQFTQIGCELIGSNCSAADAEIIRLAVKSLTLLGIKNICVDLALPAIPGMIAEHYGIEGEERRAFLKALRHRDRAEIKKCTNEKAVSCACALLGLVSDVEGGLTQFQALDMPDNIVNEVARLKEVYDIVISNHSDARISMDPLEMQGFDYQTGLCFTIFVRGERAALGRGGRYITSHSHEAATGFSFYMDSLLRIVTPPPFVPRLYFPSGYDKDIAERLRKEGHVVIEGLLSLEEKKAEEEASMLGCVNFYGKDGIRSIA
jgi:ATP phosphoribosyltransferase regulatory subunit